MQEINQRGMIQIQGSTAFIQSVHFQDN